MGSAALHAAITAAILRQAPRLTPTEQMSSGSITLALDRFGDPEPLTERLPEQRDAPSPPTSIDDLPHEQPHRKEMPELAPPKDPTPAHAMPTAAPQPPAVEPAAQHRSHPPPKATPIRPQPKPAAPPPTAHRAPTPAQSPQGRGTRTTANQPGAERKERASAEQAYLAALRQAIAHKRHYPASARRREQTGIATVAFVVHADGRIRQVRLVKSSGHSALDRAALETLHRLDRFRPIPASIGRQRWAMQVPIAFDLR